jgi:hypothetical protein
MIARAVQSVGLVGWLIYGNVIYYSSTNDCQANAYGLNLLMLLLIVIGYFQMLKCFCYGTFIAISIPFFLMAYRRQRQPNWVPVPPNFIKKLARNKFDPTQNVAFEACAICMKDYTSKDEIICLPCDDKHYFHAKCISEWLKRNNNCPLCKATITQEALNEQKAKRNSNKRR